MNFMMHCIYVHAFLLYTEDYKKKIRVENENSARIDQIYEKKES